MNIQAYQKAYLYPGTGRELLLNSMVILRVDTQSPQQLRLSRRALDYDSIDLDDATITWGERQVLGKRLRTSPSLDEDATFTYTPPFCDSETIRYVALAERSHPILEAKVRDAQKYVQAWNYFHKELEAIGLHYIVSDEDVCVLPLLHDAPADAVLSGPAFTVAILWPSGQLPLDKIVGKVEVCKPQYAEGIARLYSEMQERFNLGAQSIVTR